MRNFFAGLFLLLGVGCLGVAGFSAYQDRVISPQMSSASSPVLFSQVSDISSYVSLPVLEGMQVEEVVEEKNYDAELIKRGVKAENIHHYGFAFKGKEVLIDGR